MSTPVRLAPLLAQFDLARTRLGARLVGPSMDSGDGESIDVPALDDEEYLWEPAPGSWSIRRKADGPGPGATILVGAGDWGRDGGRPHPWPPPITTIAWRLAHLSEMLAGRAEYTIGSHSGTEMDYVLHGAADAGVRAFETAADSWREALVAADDAALDRVGHCSYPTGSDPEDPFLEVVWWVNQEVLHHGAEIGLLRDLYRAGR